MWSCRADGQNMANILILPSIDEAFEPVVRSTRRIDYDPCTEVSYEELRFMCPDPPPFLDSPDLFSRAGHRENCN